MGADQFPGRNTRRRVPIIARRTRWCMGLSRVNRAPNLPARHDVLTATEDRWLVRRCRPLALPALTLYQPGHARLPDWMICGFVEIMLPSAWVLLAGGCSQCVSHLGVRPILRNAVIVYKSRNRHRNICSHVNLHQHVNIWNDDFVYASWSRAEVCTIT